ncbi:lipopolysaccharide assembly protein LapB [Erythrobacter sp. KY5]|uniref:tetratricopeptide repeat protein n=1 Tax=Erythrobacter sp. KY5 TaxID=2011159 RepID=UPI0013A6AB60|nr:tetratricopeptide repeat protein [Erythrobacter sp. KY5]
MRNFLAIIGAVALCSCSGDSEIAASSSISGGDDFLELIDDARVAVNAGNLSEAGRYYDEARALEPDNPGLWVDIARLRFRGGEHLTAIEAADYALELDPQYPSALLMRAQLVRDANGLAESLVWFETAALAAHSDPEILADYAATLGELGRYSDMLKVVRQLAVAAPNHPHVHFLQAVLAARAGDPVLAGSLLNRSGLVGRGVASAMMLDAIVNLQQGTYDTAAETLQTLAERQPANVRVNELLARALWLGGRDRALVDRFEGQASRNNASPYIVMLVGRSLERMGDRERAIPFIERALEGRTDDQIILEGSARPGGRLPIATAELRDFVGAGSLAPARRLADILLERAPSSGDIHSLAGDTYLASDETQRALELYEVSARVRRSWPLTRKMVEAFMAYGDQVSAEVLLTRHIAGDPHNTEALLLLAQRSAGNEDWLRTAVLLDTAIGLGAGNDLEVLALRADAARALGEEEDAERFDQLLTHLKPGEFLSL